MATEIALIEPGPFEVACPGDYVSLGNLTEIWLGRYAARTGLAYWQDLKRWLEFCGRTGVSYRDARMAHADAWIAEQRAEGAAERSIARRLAAVSSWYKYLIKNTGQDASPLAVRNPADTDARPVIHPEDSPTIALSRSEAGQLIATADIAGPAESALVRILLMNGLRIGSVLDARIEDLGRDSGHRTLTLTVKGGRQKRIPLPPPVTAAVDAMLAARGTPTAGLLFMTRRGRPMFEMQAYRTIKKLAKQAGIPQWDKLTPHGLRATVITVFLERGGSLADAQALAGHADPRTTLIYHKRMGQLAGHAAYVTAAQYGTGDYGVRADADG